MNALQPTAALRQRRAPLLLAAAWGAALSILSACGGGGGGGGDPVGGGSTNAAPVAASVNVSVPEGTADQALGLSAPTDAEGDALTITVTALPTAGVVTLADGTPLTLGQTLSAAQLTALQYDAPTEVLAASTTQFGYSVADASHSVSGAAAFNLVPVNDNPVASSATLAVGENTPPLPLGLAASDVDGDTLAVTVTALPSTGSVSLAGGAALAVGQVITASELAALQYNAPALLARATTTSFDYSVSDGQVSATGQATLNLTPGTMTLSVTSGGAKSLNLSWSDVPTATLYRLESGVAGIFVPVGADLTATSTQVSVPVHKTDWVNTQYRVRAYDGSGGLLRSSAATNIDTLMLASIAQLGAGNASASDFYGVSLSLSGDGNTLAVGASSEDGSGTGINPASNEAATDAGAVYVYTRSGGSWVQQAYLKASNAEAGDRFGISVSLSNDGNTLVVGAALEDGLGLGINPPDNNLGTDSGAAYVYTRSGSTWSQSAYLKASNTGPSDYFGIAVSVSGDGSTVAVGALNEDGGGTGISPLTNEAAANAGAVYVYVRAGSTWAQQAYLKAHNTGAGDQLGASVALSADGNTLVTGAPAEDGSGRELNPASDEAANGAGAVYVFSRSGTTWSHQAYVKAFNTGAGDQFGTSVAVSGDGNTLLVGAPGEDGSAAPTPPRSDEAASGAGAAYAYTRSGTSWTFSALLKAGNAGAGDLYGRYVSISGDGRTLAVGAPNESGSGLGINPVIDEASSLSGAVYVYRPNPGLSISPWGQVSYVKASRSEVNRNFGTVSLSTDGNTLAVGAPLDDRSTTSPITNAGAVYLY
jgi:hypothetical protein